jgi:hypothetical protein
MSKFTDNRLFRLTFITFVLMLAVTPLLYWIGTFLEAPFWLVFIISLLGCGLLVNRYQIHVH